MSLYEVVFGDGDRGLPLLGLLGFERTTDVGRYRSAWLEDVRAQTPEVPLRIAVYTRNGGGNRGCHRDEWNEVADADCGEPGCHGCIITHRLPAHPEYVFDRDDEFDSTYATVWFRVPEKHLPELLALADAHPGAFPVVDTSQRWLDAIDALERGGP